MTQQSFESRKAMEEFLSESIDDVMDMIKTLDHPVRFKIIISLISTSKTFRELSEITNLQTSALGNHLSVLIEKKLIEKIVRGLYRLTEDGNDLIEAFAYSYLNTKIREQERLLKLQKLIGKYTNIEDETMSVINNGDLDIKIMKLAPMKVVSFHAMGKKIGEPEEKAHRMLQEFAGDYLKNPEKYLIYGFNNPDPSPENEEYGYEFWMKIPEDEPLEVKDVLTKDVDGGMYAVTSTRLLAGNDMLSVWKGLVEWVKKSVKYDFAQGYCLEKHLNPLASPENLILELHLPIKEK